MKIGVDYYPEQWDSTLWEKDAGLMARTGVKVVRIAEFAWSKLEPRDGEFVFGWLDELMRIFARYGIDVVMGIPTNCPPLWLYRIHPEIVMRGADEKPIQTGIRGHRCINSDVFLSYAKRITERIVRHYSSSNQIIAWQIDNELEAYHCTCEVCRKKFREWLLDKHDTLENINSVFGNSVWSGEYSDISEIQPPTAYPKTWQNPSLCMEYQRFSSECTAKYVKELAMIIKREIPKAKVTVNAWLGGSKPDIYKFFDEVDFVSFDNYPPINIPADKDELYSHTFFLDMMRGVKGKKFWIMEQLSGPTGSWEPMSQTPRPGQIMGYSLQAIAHGADTVMHFRWRTAVTGAEMFWHGLIDHSNVPGRRFNEFTELCKSISKLGVIDTTEIVSDIAILYSPENEWAFKIQPQTEGFDYIQQLRFFHKAFSHYGANVDVVSPESDLSSYKVVIAPAMFVYKKQAAENIYRYAINGGTLILTNRSGVKDQNNNCMMQPLPSVYKELVGAEVSEYDPIGNNNQTIVDFAGNRFSCSQWCDILSLTTAKAYAEYDDGFYRCCPAVTMNRYCSGVIYYVGTVCEMDFYKSFAGNVMLQTGIPRLNDLPDGVEVTTRTNGLDDFIFFFNNSDEGAEIRLPKAMYSVIDSVGKDRISLKPFGFDIVRK
ncbi:MAG TPA: beta-galactosidase [Ruminococcus sp.]|nr:beta-galactosidase [Ruminococcus sp.]